MYLVSLGEGGPYPKIAEPLRGLLWGPAWAIGSYGIGQPVEEIHKSSSLKPGERVDAGRWRKERAIEFRSERKSNGGDATEPRARFGVMIIGVCRRALSDELWRASKYCGKKGRHETDRTITPILRHSSGLTRQQHHHLAFTPHSADQSGTMMHGHNTTRSTLTLHTLCFVPSVAMFCKKLLTLFHWGGIL